MWGDGKSTSRGRRCEESWSRPSLVTVRALNTTGGAPAPAARRLAEAVNRLASICEAARDGPALLLDAEQSQRQPAVHRIARELQRRFNRGGAELWGGRLGTLRIARHQSEPQAFLSRGACAYRAAAISSAQEPCAHVLAPVAPGSSSGAGLHAREERFRYYTQRPQIPAVDDEEDRARLVCFPEKVHAWTTW